METFSGSKPSAMHSVDHIDRDKTNNHVSNLRWATNSEQVMNQSNKHPFVQVNGFTGEVIGRFAKLEEMKRKLQTHSQVIHSVSGRREWFAFFDKETLRARRIEFVQKRLAITRGTTLNGKWFTVASGFFENHDRCVRKQPSSGADMASFAKKQVAANCIKFHMRSWMCFRRNYSDLVASAS